MKITSIICFLSMICFITVAQTDKSKRASPLDNVTVTTDEGININITYSKPSVKGRELGVDIAPVGKVWRTGANEATTFEVDQNVTIEGKSLSAGKYSLYSIPGEQQTTLIFNKTWDQWGTKYDKSTDALRVDVNNGSGGEFQEQFTISAQPSGLITLSWGDYAVPFNVKKK